jgi:hypothetical protein
MKVVVAAGGSNLSDRASPSSHGRTKRRFGGQRLLLLSPLGSGHRTFFNALGDLSIGLNPGLPCSDSFVQ